LIIFNSLFEKVKI